MQMNFRIIVWTYKVTAGVTEHGYARRIWLMQRGMIHGGEITTEQK